MSTTEFTKLRTTVNEIRPLTSLRFVAALFVFLQHASIFGGYGSLAVTFFFVLSGFVLTIGYHNKLRNVTDIKYFYFLRFARLYPAHFITMMATLIFVVYINYGIPSISIFLKRVFLVHVYIYSGEEIFSFNGLSWSVANELFFYLCFPIIVMFLTLVRLNLSLSISITSLLITIFISGSIAMAIPTPITPLGKSWWFLYTFPGYRILDFIVGVITGFIFLRVRSNKIKYDSALEMISIAFFLATVRFAYLSPWQMQFSTHYLLSIATIILCFAISNGPTAKLLSKEPFVKLGHISYGFFLIHVPMIEFVNRWSEGRFWTTESNVEWALLRSLVFVLTLIASWLLFRLVEQPIMSYSKNLVRRARKKHSSPFETIEPAT